MHQGSYVGTSSRTGGAGRIAQVVATTVDITNRSTTNTRSRYLIVT